jgi:hypothetical protein
LTILIASEAKIKNAGMHNQASSSSLTLTWHLINACIETLTASIKALRKSSVSRCLLPHQINTDIWTETDLTTLQITIAKNMKTISVINASEDLLVKRLRLLGEKQSAVDDKELAG